MITALLRARLVDRLTEASAIPYGVDLVLDGRVEYPGVPPTTVEGEERAECVTA